MVEIRLLVIQVEANQMNMKISIPQPMCQTISSRELSILCDKQHGHVCRDIEALNQTYEKMGLSKIGEGYYTHPNTGSQQHREFLLSKEQTIDLITGYKSELRIKINRRWAELEKQSQSNVIALPNFTDPAEAARAWAEQFEAKQLAEKQITILAPKAEALDTIADTTNTYCLRECAKTIGIKESELIKLLLDKKWIYRDSDRKLQPHAQYVLNKVFTNRTSPVIANKNDGKERVFLHMRVTAFGLTRITGLVNKVRNAKQVAA